MTEIGVSGSCRLGKTDKDDNRVGVKPPKDPPSQTSNDTLGRNQKEILQGDTRHRSPSYRSGVTNRSGIDKQYCASNAGELKVGIDTRRRPTQQLTWCERQGRPRR